MKHARAVAGLALLAAGVALWSGCPQEKPVTSSNGGSATTPTPAPPPLTPEATPTPAPAPAPAPPPASGPDGSAPVVPPAPPPGPGANAATGTLAGRVTVARKVDAPAPVANAKDTDSCGLTYDPGTLQIGADGALAGAVVFLKGAKAPADWKPSGDYVLDQKACHYVPNVLLVPAGRAITFTNSDAVLHNVKWTSMNNGNENLAVPPGGKVEHTFQHAEFMGLGCAVHPFMEGTGSIVVTDHPWYTLTDATGAYRLADIPPGTYKLLAWHQLLKRALKEGVSVTIEPGKPRTIDIRFE